MLGPTVRITRLLALAGWLLVACATAGDRPNNPDGPPPGDANGDTSMGGGDANNCTMQPCDILPQCGCASDQACDIDGSDLVGTACRTVSAPAKPEGGSCSTAAQCEAGTVCLGGFCRKYCNADGDCSAPRGTCVIDIQDSNGNPIAGIPTACSSNCDPANSAGGGCESTAKCGFFSATHNGVTSDIVACTAPGTGTQGVSCQGGGQGDDAMCAANFSCTTTNGTTFVCRQVCKVVGGACAIGSCISFNPALTIAGTEYGVCN